MSSAVMVVCFPKREPAARYWFAIYEGTVDYCAPGLFPNEEVAQSALERGSKRWWECSCTPKGDEYIECWCQYAGQGWRSTACFKCKAITGDLGPLSTDDDGKPTGVELLPSKPKWVEDARETWGDRLYATTRAELFNRLIKHCEEKRKLSPSIQAAVYREIATALEAIRDGRGLGMAVDVANWTAQRIDEWSTYVDKVIADLRAKGEAAEYDTVSDAYFDAATMLEEASAAWAGHVLEAAKVSAPLPIRVAAVDVDSEPDGEGGSLH